MAYRETVIDGRIFLEIVPDPPQAPAAPYERRPEVDDAAEDDARGVWIGDLVPDHTPNA